MTFKEDWEYLQINTINTRLDNLSEKMDDGFSSVNKRLDALPKEIASTLSNEVVPVLSEQLHDIKTEVSIIKSAVGEHELDIKYLSTEGLYAENTYIWLGKIQVLIKKSLIQYVYL